MTDTPLGATGECATCGRPTYLRGIAFGMPGTGEWVHADWSTGDYDHDVEPAARVLTVEVTTTLHGPDPTVVAQLGLNPARATVVAARELP